MEETNEMTCQVSVVVTKLGDARNSHLTERLGGDEELIDGHGRVNRHNLACEQVQLDLLNGARCLLLD